MTYIRVYRTSLLFPFSGRFGDRGLAVSIITSNQDLSFIHEIYRVYKKDNTPQLEDLIHHLGYDEVETALEKVRQ